MIKSAPFFGIVVYTRKLVVLYLISFISLSPFTLSHSKLGIFTSLYYLFSTLAAIAGPNINGWIVQLTGKITPW